LNLLDAITLAVVEALTEFIPFSHMSSAITIREVAVFSPEHGASKIVTVVG
jgi:undecaprenyl pyrophosphate phosphatase UppP